MRRSLDGRSNGWISPLTAALIGAGLERRSDAPWSWTFWEAAIDLPPGEHELAVRASGLGRPDATASATDVWNFKGYLCTAWHRVQIGAVSRPSGFRTLLPVRTLT